MVNNSSRVYPSFRQAVALTSVKDPFSPTQKTLSDRFSIEKTNALQGIFSDLALGDISCVGENTGDVFATILIRYIGYFNEPSSNGRIIKPLLVDDGMAL